MKTKKPKVKILHIPTGIIFEVPNYLSFCELFSKNLNEMDFHMWQVDCLKNPEKLNNISYSTFTGVRKLLEILHYAKITPEDNNEYTTALLQLRNENTIEYFEILYD
ncbi:MAG: hypothetical protein JHC33_02145 [Ignisphaera sp.]|nr:hypothetical protein [Ignisphaera sp.]